MRCSTFLTLFIAATLASAATVEKRKNVDRPNPSGTEHCPGNSPGDADACTFESQETGPDSVIEEIVGDPVDNCKGGTTDLKTTIGGDKTVAQTWKYGVSVGFGADGGEELPVGVEFKSSDTWSNTEAKTFRQNVQAALIAKITAKTFLGRVRINYGDPTGEAGKDDYHYIWYNNGVGSIQPTDQVTYDQRIVNCDEDI
ncbi:hypothetical protein V5O48_008054 [Marasmius crinis-equi]|uniref:Uncharacterized protein n=1 Tax=Marasmius crinis-equi TaxID=585013 RepID=A0ABR3FF06_9AGAR